MCGIFGYISEDKVDAATIILDGLRRLEYRGYDSAGIAVLYSGGILLKKRAGRIANLQESLTNLSNSTLAIGHTRWATHGVPTDVNSHPHTDCKKRIFVVHNGIIENYQTLKNSLKKRGHKFISDTDTEVVAHLVEEFSRKHNFEEAVRLSLKLIHGAYALAIIDYNNPNILIVAKNSSPLVIGFGNNIKYIASDVSAILPYTRDVIYLQDGETAVIGSNNLKISNLDRKVITRKKEKIEWSEDEVKKGNFPHFMLKEINEEAVAVENAIRGRIIKEEGIVKLGGLEAVKTKLDRIKSLKITGCGTAYFAGLLGEYMLEEYGHIPAKAEYASELRYKNGTFDLGTAYLAISQSGETADTLGVIKEAKRKGALTLGVVNTVGSSIAKETHAGVYNHAGPEIGVASTKAFASQVTIMVLLSLFFGRRRGLSLTSGRELIDELQKIPQKMNEFFSQKNQIKNLVKKYSIYKNFLYIGRKFNYPVVMEGALKLKEVSYVHAEGYGAGEMKHGSIAMIDKNFPVIAIAPQDSMYQKMMSNIQEIKARNGRIIAIATKGDNNIKKFVDDVIYVPETFELFYPFLTVLPLHLFAYYFGVMRGYDVDKPRNLAKSVTVE